MLDVRGVVSAHPAEAQSVVPLKHVARVNLATLDETTDPNHAFDYVDISSVAPDVGIARRERLTFGTAPSRARRTVARGDTIVSTVRTYLRAVAFVDEPDDLVVSTGFAVLSPGAGVDPRYLYRAVQSKPFVDEVVARSTGVSYPAINPGELGRIGVHLPDACTQRAIADFLDREAEKIDALVAKKRRLIELLQEQRTALVSHAVTKGLDSDVPMEDSGVEWLGELPKGWQAVQLKHLCSVIRDGTHQPPARVEEGYPLLSVRNIVDGKLVNLADDSMITHEDFRDLTRSLRVQTDDVAMAIVGATLGKVAIVQEMPPFAVQRSIAVFRVRPESVVPRFLALFLASAPFQSLLWANVGFSAQPGIYLGTLASFPIAIAPLADQQAIVKFLDGETLRIDTLISKMREAVDQLREYRSALITAAVTGQIDVRTYRREAS